MRYTWALACTLAASPLPEALAQSQGQSAARPDSAIIAAERRGWEAIKRKDTRALFDAAGGGEFLHVQPWGARRMSLANSPNAFANCETKSYAMDSVTVSPAGANAAVLTYRLTLDQTCGAEKVPSPMYVTEVWTKRNGKWVVVTRTDTIILQGPTR